MPSGKTNLDITILCKVVDNFGDIGFVYRLIRRLAQISDASVRLVCSDLKAFSLLNPQVKPDVPFQQIERLAVFDWNDAETCGAEFSANFPTLILECFQCGRPDWLEEILFPPKEVSAQNPICQIINIDYLTAEPYAETFHCLQSLTRSARVKKVNFMPGFSPNTGGLVLDEPFFSAALSPRAKLSADFRILMFIYEKDFSPLFWAVNKFAQNRAEGGVQIFVAQGRGKDSFLESEDNFRAKCQTNFSIESLPFLRQTDWDVALLSYDFLFVRGEDSLTRAALSGVPFVWHAYRQDDDYQLVKVQALLDVMKPFFCEDETLFAALEQFWLDFNKSETVSWQEETFAYLLENTAQLSRGFQKFASYLIGNGDFAEKLLEYINGLGTVGRR